MHVHVAVCLGACPIFPLYLNHLIPTELRLCAVMVVDREADYKPNRLFLGRQANFARGGRATTINNQDSPSRAPRARDTHYLPAPSNGVESPAWRSELLHIIVGMLTKAKQPDGISQYTISAIRFSSWRALNPQVKILIR